MSVSKTEAFLALIVLASGLAAMGAAPTTALAQIEANMTTPSNSTSLAGNSVNTEEPTLEFSSQPVWDEKATATGMTPINETHTRVEFVGNGTIIDPDTGEAVDMNNTGYGIVTGMNPVLVYGRENVFAEDGDTTAITYYEIARYDPTTFQGMGIIIGVFDDNATGSLEPFNGMIVAGIHDDNPGDPEGATIKLWEWQGGIDTTNVSSVMHGESPMSNSTTS